MAAPFDFFKPYKYIYTYIIKVHDSCFPPKV